MQAFLRRLSILEFLRTNKAPQTTQEILRHLVNAGYMDEGLEPGSQLRLVQRDMRFLYGADPKSRESETDWDMDNELGLICTRGPGKTWAWSLEPYSALKFDFEKMPQYLAIAFAMTKKHLSGLLPKNTLTDLERFFYQADAKLEKSQQQYSAQALAQFKDAVEFYQRGQSLHPAQYNIEHLDTIYRAIIRKKQCRLRYRGKDYMLHPCGVAILLPKLYLVAVKESDIEQAAIENPASFRHFLIHKIESIQVEQKNKREVSGFSLKRYLQLGHMEVLADSDKPNLYKLKMRIAPNHQSSNLISDLLESPLVADQQLEQLSENRWLLTATVRYTIQLRNWIINLGPEVTVVSPKLIREGVKQELRNLLSNY